ncbi:hypothetical protein D9M71_568100 [compost metagenome]
MRAGDLHQLRAVQVGRRAASRERHRKVGLAQVQRVAVVLGEHRDTADTQLGGGTGDADGDLATVGDQQGLDGSGHGEGPRVPMGNLRQRAASAAANCAATNTGLSWRLMIL